MDYKQQILDNAWGGYFLDYGLLHVQLATPLVAMIILFVVMYFLNKLLFQPVLRTLDERNRIIEDNRSKASGDRSVIDTIKAEYEKQVETTRQEVAGIYQSARKEAGEVREKAISEARQSAENELENQRGTLSQEVAKVKKDLEKAANQIAGATVEKLLS